MSNALQNFQSDKAFIIQPLGKKKKHGFWLNEGVI